MTYEVELKFPLRGLADVRSQLQRIGATPDPVRQQRDLYFSHPAKEFFETDEALRIRCVADQNCLTYKGPLVDARTKTRREIEIPFQAGKFAAEQMADLLRRLGFQPVHEVVKARIPFQLVWESRNVELALDEVEGLGSFLEIEILAAASAREQAQDSILRLAERLGLQQAEHRSYLCLLLQQNE